VYWSYHMGGLLTLNYTLLTISCCQIHIRYI